MKSHTLTVRGQLLSINHERQVHHQRRAEWVAQWRKDAGWEARAARIPHLDRVSIVATPFQHGNRLGDAGNHLPTVKAVIDGLVDVGVLDDDGPEQVSALTMMAPQRTTQWKCDYVTVELVEVGL